VFVRIESEDKENSEELREERRTPNAGRGKRLLALAMKAGYPAGATPVGRSRRDRRRLDEQTLVPPGSQRPAVSGRVKNEERRVGEERSTLNAQRSTLKFGRGKRRLDLALQGIKTPNS